MTNLKIRVKNMIRNIFFKEEFKKLNDSIYTLTQINEMLKTEIKYTTDELKSRISDFEAETSKLKQNLECEKSQFNEIKYKISKLHSKTNDELKEIFEGNFDVFKNDEGGYSVATGICSYGGCYMGVISLDNKRMAYHVAAELTLTIGKMSSGTCRSCYDEYSQSCM